MAFGFFEANHAREIARNTKRLRDVKPRPTRPQRRDLNDAQPFWIGKAVSSLIYTTEPSTIQSVSVKMWSYDGSAEGEGTETVVAHDWLKHGCLKGEPLWLYRRPWADGFRWYFVGSWNAIIVKGTCSARSGTTPGSGSCDWYTINSSGALVDTTENVTCLNLATSSTDSANYLQAKKVRGIWLIDFEECA